MIVEKKDNKIYVDLKGPGGNAFALLGLAEDLCRKCSLTREETKDIISDMESGDYENLINILDGVFGDILVMSR